MSDFYYTLTLCKTNLTPLYEISVSNFSYTRKYRGYDSLSIVIEREQYDRNTKQLKINPVWEVICPEQIVLLKQFGNGELMFSEYFVVQDPVMADGKTSLAKTINLIPYHQRLFSKTQLNGYDDTRKIFDFEYTVDDDGTIHITKDSTTGYPIPVAYDMNDNTKGGVINYILENCLKGNINYDKTNPWKVVYFDEGLFNDNITSFLPSQTNEILFGEGCVVTGDDTIGYTITDGNTVFEDDSDYEGTSITSVLTKGIRPYWFTYTNNGFVCDKLNDWLELVEDFDKYLNFSTSITQDFDKMVTEIEYDFDELKGYLYASSTATENTARYNRLRKDSFLGHKLLSFVENIMTNLQGITNLFMGAINITDTYSYQLATLDFFNEVLQNLYTPLLPYENAINKIEYRANTFTTNLDSVFDTLADSYKCVFIFDNVKRDIYIYARNNKYINHDKNIILSDKAWMIDFNLKKDTTSSLTRLRIKGADDVTVGQCSPDGNPYIDNFKKYMDLKYMSQDLINALTTYYSKIEDYQTITTSFTYVIYENRVQKTVYVNDISFERLLNKIDSVSELYNKYKVAYDQYTATDEALNSLIHEHSQEERTTKEEEFKVKRNAYEEQIASIMLSVGLAELDPDTGDISYDEQDLEDAYHSAQSKYNAYLLAISNIQNSLKYENVKDGNDNNIFSNELLNELNEFIYEGEYKVDSISNPQTLYLYGVQYLEYLTEPSIEITSNLIDIFDNDNMCKYWKRFNNIGDYAIIDYSDAGYEYQSFRMSELTHTISSNDTSLKISLTNKEELSTELKDIINNVWFYAYKTARDFNKYKTTWEKYSQKIQDAISEGQKISAEMNNIINKTGATVADSGGITASRQDGNSLFTANDGIYCKTSNFATVNPSTGDIEVKEKRGTVIINGATYTDDEDNDLMTININGENGSAGYIQDTLMSNLRLYVLKPEITISNNTVIWSGGDTHTWAFASTDISVSNIRLYTVIDKDSIEVKEEHLIMSVRSGIVETNVRNLTIDGKQVYWTEIRTTANEQHPYEYLTFVPPTNTSLIEMYKVKIPAVVNGNQSYTKLRIEGIYNSSEDTNEMKFTFGAGDNNGNNQMKIIKETYSGRMIYTDTNGQEYGVKLSYDLGENTHRVRQITAGVETDIYPQIVVSDLDDAADMPDNSIIFLREESE